MAHRWLWLILVLFLTYINVIWNIDRTPIIYMDKDHYYYNDWVTGNSFIELLYDVLRKTKAEVHRQRFAKGNWQTRSNQDRVPLHKYNLCMRQWKVRQWLNLRSVTCNYKTYKRLHSATMQTFVSFYYYKALISLENLHLSHSPARHFFDRSISRIFYKIVQ